MLAELPCPLDSVPQDPFHCPSLPTPSSSPWAALPSNSSRLLLLQCGPHQSEQVSDPPAAELPHSLDSVPKDPSHHHHPFHLTSPEARPCPTPRFFHCSAASVVQMQATTDRRTRPPHAPKIKLTARRPTPNVNRTPY